MKKVDLTWSCFYNSFGKYDYFFSGNNFWSLSSSSKCLNCFSKRIAWQYIRLQYFRYWECLRFTKKNKNRKSFLTEYQRLKHSLASFLLNAKSSVNIARLAFSDWDRVIPFIESQNVESHFLSRKYNSSKSLPHQNKTLISYFILTSQVRYHPLVFCFHFFGSDLKLVYF